ncbi:hypothetical protein CA85_17880 [Allorhodopirellula solitaria]|uniref:Uncharacterized protein n=1 Tax=Allorhodopirellula solitaria TaxID=2527987 RepID=A0A5C5YEG0_9BACT|nr:hypothetical protein CA85_17880 [Allorhodopirellula solitaria]
MTSAGRVRRRQTNRARMDHCLPCDWHRLGSIDVEGAPPCEHNRSGLVGPITGRTARGGTCEIASQSPIHVSATERSTYFQRRGDTVNLLRRLSTAADRLETQPCKENRRSRYSGWTARVSDCESSRYEYRLDRGYGRLQNTTGDQRKVDLGRYTARASQRLADKAATRRGLVVRFFIPVERRAIRHHSHRFINMVVLATM